MSVKTGINKSKRDSKEREHRQVQCVLFKYMYETFKDRKKERKIKKKIITTFDSVRREPRDLYVHNAL